MCSLKRRKVPLMGFLQHRAKSVQDSIQCVQFFSAVWDFVCVRVCVCVCVCCVNQATIVIPVGDLLPPQDRVCVCVAIMQHGVSGTGV